MTSFCLLHSTLSAAPLQHRSLFWCQQHVYLNPTPRPGVTFHSSDPISLRLVLHICLLLVILWRHQVELAKLGVHEWVVGELSARETGEHGVISLVLNGGERSLERPTVRQMLTYNVTESLCGYRCTAM